jgi:hypothetical protein
MKDETGNGPADNSPLVSGEMGGQFQAIRNNFSFRPGLPCFPFSS